MKSKRRLLQLIGVLAIVMFFSSCYYYYTAFALLTGTWHVKYSYWDEPSEFGYNTITFNPDGTYTMGEDDWLFGNRESTRTWSQDGDQLSLRNVYQTMYYTQTVDFTATLTDSGSDEASAGSGTYNFNLANGTTKSGSSDWWLSRTGF